jgi:hypothetical protein
MVCTARPSASSAWKNTGTPLGTRIGLTVCLFLIAFAAVGQSFNQYWGALVAPLLCFGVVRFPMSLVDLCRAAHKPALESPS